MATTNQNSGKIGGVLCMNSLFLPMKAHYFLFNCANFLINSFMVTIAIDNGYLLIGDIFIYLLLLNVVVKPLTGYVTDKWKCRRAAFLGSILLNGLLTPTLYLEPGSESLTGKTTNAEVAGSWQFWLFWAVVVLKTVLFMVAEVLQDTICMRISDGSAVKFGMQRLWGSIGSGLMAIVAGSFIKKFSNGHGHDKFLMFYLLSMAAFLADFAVACQLKIPESEAPPENILKDVKNVMKNAKVCVFLVWATAGGLFTIYVTSYIMWYVYELINEYHPEQKSIFNSIKGFPISIDHLGGEVLFFYLSGHLIKRTGHMTAFSISFAMFAFRFLIYSIIRDPWWILPMELLHGFTSGLSYIAGISYSAKIAPVGSEGTVQGLFSMMFQGFGSFIGAMLAKDGFNRFGSIMAFRLIGFGALITCIIQIIVNQFMNRRTKLVLHKRESA